MSLVKKKRLIYYFYKLISKQQHLVCFRNHHLKTISKNQFLKTATDPTLSQTRFGIGNQKKTSLFHTRNMNQGLPIDSYHTSLSLYIYIGQ
jgi:hypothetical protein